MKMAGRIATVILPAVLELLVGFPGAPSMLLGQSWCGVPIVPPDAPSTEVGGPGCLECKLRRAPDTGNAPKAPCTGSLCFVGSGAYATWAIDLTIPTSGLPLVAYRLSDSTHSVDGPLGHGWLSNLQLRLYYALYLFAAPSTYQYRAAITMPDGARYVFSQNADGSFAPPQGRNDSLIRNGDGSFDLTFQFTSSKLHFGSDGSPLSLTDDYGNTISFSYDGNGRLFQVTDASGSGRYLTVSWGADGRISSVQDSAGRQVQYSYNAQGALATGTDAANRVTTYSYVAGRFSPLLSQITDKWSRVVGTVAYDATDRLTSYMEDGETYTYSRANQPPNVVAKTDSFGATTLGYATGGYITDTTPPAGAGARVHMDVNLDGSIQQISTPDVYGSPKTLYAYDSNARLASATRDSGGQTAIRYDYAYDSSFPAKVISITPKDPSTGAVDPDWQAWQYDYYQAGDPAPGALHHVYRVESDGTTLDTLATYVYDSHARVTRSTSATGGTTDYGYDSQGNLTTVTGPANNDGGTRPVTTYGYDSLGRVTSVTDALGHITSYVYDSLNRVTSVTLPKPSSGSGLNFTTAYSYDNYDSATGLVFTNVTDPNGSVPRQGYDEFGHLVKSLDALGNVTTYAYQHGLLSSITDANGNVTSYSYDVGRRLSTVTAPDGKTEQYTYRYDNLLSQRFDRLNQRFDYGYDNLLRLSQISYQGAGKVLTYTFQGQKLMTVYNQYPSEESHNFTYDASYRVASIAEGTRGTVSYQYNGDDRVTYLAVTSGPTTTYSYYPDGSLNTMQWSPVSGQFKYQYTLAGQYQTVTLPNGATRNSSYDDQGRLAQLSNLASGGSNLATYGYGYDYDYTNGQYDRLGQRVSLTATVPSQGLNNHLFKYEYDLLYELNKVTYPNVAPFNAEVDSWTYDSIGNRLTNTINGSTQTYTYQKIGSNPNNWQRLLSDGVNSYAYDANGSTLSRNGSPGNYTFGWDYNNRMSSISGSATASYVYDYQGRRSSKTVSGSTSAYLYDGLNLIEETGATPADYLFGPGIDEPIAMARSGVVYYYDVDGLGSANLVTNASATVQDSYLYDAWGQTRSQTGTLANPFVYTAREFGEAGTLFYRARHYQSSIGRFLSEDVPKQQHGPSKYAYVTNSPMMYGDPTGLAIKQCFRPLRWPLKPLIIFVLILPPVPTNTLCPMHEYLYNTDTGQSKGYDPNEDKPETGHGICWTIPEPMGMCVWNNFEQAAGPRDNYNFLGHNCQNAVEGAVQSCSRCMSTPSPQIGPDRCSGGINCADAR